MKKSAPKRRTPIRKKNPERLAKRFVEDYGPYAAWIRQQPCPIPDDSGEPVEVSHVKSRGAGGKAEANLLPMTMAQHRELHQLGIMTFQKRYGVDLKAEAEKLWAEYSLLTTEEP